MTCSLYSIEVRTIPLLTTDRWAGMNCYMDESPEFELRAKQVAGPCRPI